MKKRNLVLFGSAAMLSLALAGSIGAVTAFAETTITSGGESSGLTTVTYTVSETWTVTIPDSITINAETKQSSGEDTVTISAGAILGEGKKTLKVTVKGDFKLQTESGDETIDYELRASDTTDFSGDALTDGSEVVSTEGGNEEVSKNLQAKIKDDQKPKAAGSYEDTLTFEVTQENA